MEDYECDYCFTSTSEGCQLICNDYDPYSPPTDCVDYYYQTQGYRLVVGDKCDWTKDGALNKLPIKTNCDGTTGGITTGIKTEGPKSKQNVGALILFFIFFCLLLAGFLGTFWFVKKYHKPSFLFEWLNQINKRMSSNKDINSTKGNYAPLSSDDL